MNMLTDSRSPGSCPFALLTQALTLCPRRHGAACAGANHGPFPNSGEPARSATHHCDEKRRRTFARDASSLSACHGDAGTRIRDCCVLLIRSFIHEYCLSACLSVCLVMQTVPAHNVTRQTMQVIIRNIPTAFRPIRTDNVDKNHFTLVAKRESFAKAQNVKIHLCTRLFFVSPTTPRGKRLLRSPCPLPLLDPHVVCPPHSLHLLSSWYPFPPLASP